MQELEEIGYTLAVNFIDPPSEVYLGVEAYARFQKEISIIHRTTPYATQPTTVISGVVLTTGQHNIRVDRLLPPDHISIGPYTNDNARFLRTLSKLDIAY